MTYETYLRIVIEERLQFLTQFLGRDGVIIQILKPHIQQFKQFVTVNTSRTFLHTDTEQHSLSLRNPITLCQQLNLSLGLLHKLLAHLGVLCQLHHTLNGLQ